MGSPAAELSLLRVEWLVGIPTLFLNPLARFFVSGAARVGDDRFDESESLYGRWKTRNEATITARCSAGCSLAHNYEFTQRLSNFTEPLRNLHRFKE